MQDYANSNRLSLKVLLFFMVTLFIAFLPISTFLFFLKDDAFTGYFPPKFFMSESIHAGYLPLWNPYINFGIPQYGDMSSGYWSPITWLIASTIGYNAYTLTAEVLFYILLGGVGIYMLTGTLQLNKQVRIIAGIAFMCCGYNVGHLQHFNWLSGAAFLPWCFWAYLLLLDNFSLKNSIRAALLFYLLVASAHPGITISAVYFFVAVLIFHFIKNSNKETFISRIKKLSASHLIFLLLFLLLAAGLITGYHDIIPYFSRGEKISLQSSLSNPTTVPCWISALFPFATVKNSTLFNTDIAMRNCYFSLCLFLFFLFTLAAKKNAWQKFFLVSGLLFALLSAGGIFKTFAYKFIPLIGYVRLNGEFRIFALLCFILASAIELDKFIRQKKQFAGLIKYIYFFVEIILASCIFWGLHKSYHTKESFIYNISTTNSQQGLATKLKMFADSISFYDTFWIQGIIQLLLLWLIKWCLKSRRWGLLKELVIMDMIIASLLNIPFTGAGKTSVAHVQEILDRSPQGIPVPALQPIINIDTLSTDEKLMIGDWSMYNKQIGVVKQVDYPIVLKNMDEYFIKKRKGSLINYDKEPYLFIAGINTDSEAYKPVVTAFSPNNVSFTIQSDTESNAVYQQNFYPHWYYTDGKQKKEVNKAGINFMSAPVTNGSNSISFIFEPIAVERAMIISLVSFIVCCILLIFLKSKRYTTQ